MKRLSRSLHVKRWREAISDIALSRPTPGLQKLLELQAFRHRFGAGNNCTGERSFLNLPGRGRRTERHARDADLRGRNTGQLPKRAEPALGVKEQKARPLKSVFLAPHWRSGKEGPDRKFSMIAKSVCELAAQ